MQDAQPGAQANHGVDGPRILYLGTTFPRYSETFLQREVTFLRTQPLRLDVRSLWGGCGEFQGHHIPTSNLRNLPAALVSIPGWMVRKPEAFQQVLGTILGKRLPMVQNWLENFWGFAWALQHADTLLHQQPHLIHATWGTMPAAAALALHVLTGLPYSMEAHAYDVFKHGGDWLLEEKMRHAKFIRTSTRATYNQLLKKGAPRERLHLVRRGIKPSGEVRPEPVDGVPLRILSVGRLVEKKDFSFQLEVFERLAVNNFPFRAEIVGHGPMEARLQREAHRRGLDQHVAFLGRLDYPSVEQAYLHADAFLFTGTTARNGDRDGLPNVIAEAMSHRLPVLSSPVPGALEAIENLDTGFVLPKDVSAWAEALQGLAQHPDLPTICDNARNWVDENFDICKNALTLGNLLREHACQ